MKLGKIVNAILTSGNVSQVASEEGITLTGGSGSDYIAHFTAFVDEFYYDYDPISNERVSWAAFTRQESRTMLIASSIDVSYDDNSTYSIARTSFTQRSIQTFYNSQAADEINAMGVETFCENDLFMYNTNYQNYDERDGTSTSNGRANMIELADIEGRYYQNSRWNDILVINTNGYMTPEQSRTHEIGNDNDMLLSGKQHPYYACMSRNRDLNGDGDINDNEIRWYLAASDQYLRLGIGTDAMSSESRLFMADKRTLQDADKNYPQSFYGDGALYYTSTYYDVVNRNRNKQVIWAAEVGAFGQGKQELGGHQYLVRCVRNLPSLEVDAGTVGDAALGDVSYDPDKVANRIFDFGNRLDPLIYRTADQYGPYEPHYEEPNSANDSEANRLYAGGFVVGEKNVGYNDSWQGGIWSSFSYSFADMVKIWNGDANPCEGYYDRSNPADVGRWRVPNLREMLIMSTQRNNLGLTSGYYATSTSFSGGSGTSSSGRPGFVLDGSNGFITAQPNESATFYVRCVRDANPNE